MLSDYQKKIIELMCKQELLLAKLYEIFADQFPEHKAFWQDLAKDELQHAEWIKKLYQAEEENLTAFSEGKFNPSAMNIYIENIEKTIRRAENKEITLKMAISYTLDFERSLIEKNVFSHFEIIDKKFAGIMTKLESETRRHLKKAEDMMARFR
ncbi:MAG: hypothetical protein JRC93_12130 [Deltaproteobacteria bacterium]|nr:hypothetical protein [Deltaproteobacteria bacterium]